MKVLEQEAERLDHETKRYETAAQEYRDRKRAMESGIQFASNLSSAAADQDHDTRLQDLLQEIQDLHSSQTDQREELLRFRKLYQDQHRMSKELDQMEEVIEEEGSALELEARAFDNDQEQMSRRLCDLEAEIESISSSEIGWPSLLITLQIDSSGRRYPLINELRLAYGPRGDLEWPEVQAAWSLAAQLLKIIGTLFQFPSPEWKIVPLAQCAKLIRYPKAQGGSDTTSPIVYNLGHPHTRTSEALLAWNTLLYEVVEDTSAKMKQAHKEGLLDHSSILIAPYVMTCDTIDGIALKQLMEHDHACWAQVIHCLSANLQWLSSCSSCHILQQVILASFCTGTSEQEEDSK